MSIMILDGYELYVGDNVYDTQYKQWVVVKEVKQNSFVGAIKGRTYTYTGNGFVNGTKVAFWHEPILIVPPKDVNLWRSQSKAYGHIVDAVSELQATNSTLK